MESQIKKTVTNIVREVQQSDSDGDENNSNNKERRQYGTSCKNRLPGR